MHEHQHSAETSTPGASSRNRWRIALIGFAALAVLLFVYEHRVHIPFGNLLVILPLFACIGLHSFMHGGHGGHGGHGDTPSGPDAAYAPDRQKDVQP